MMALMTFDEQKSDLSSFYSINSSIVEDPIYTGLVEKMERDWYYANFDSIIHSSTFDSNLIVQKQEEDF